MQVECHDHQPPHAVGPAPVHAAPCVRASLRRLQAKRRGPPAAPATPCRKAVRSRTCASMGAHAFPCHSGHARPTLRPGALPGLTWLRSVASSYNPSAQGDRWALQPLKYQHRPTGYQPYHCQRLVLRRGERHQHVPLQLSLTMDWWSPRSQLS